MPQDRNLIGQIVGGCRVVARLDEGGGGQGELFRAEDLEQESIPVALKVMQPSAAAHPGALERFQREATIPRLVEGHENLVRVYRSGRDPRLDLPYLVMELFEGESVAKWLADCLARGAPPPVDQAREVLMQATRGVAALHRSHAMVVHRDLKPGNLFRHRTPQRALRVKVLDFGSAAPLNPAGLQALTQHPARVPITPAYAAPELKAGAQAGPPADVFSLGAIGYELFSGRRPYSLLQDPALQRGDPVHLEPLPAHVPAHLRAAITRALAPRPEQRFRDAEQLLEALERPARPPRPLRWLAWPAAAALLLLLGIVGWRALREKDRAAPPPPHLPPTAETGEPRRWRAVSAAGSSHICALTVDDQAWCWGENAMGELGKGTPGASGTPAPVAGGHRYREIGVGARFTCGLTDEGETYCWGDDSQDQLGGGGAGTSPVPRRVPLPGRAAALSVGRSHACADTAVGEWYCWGSNSAGQLGPAAEGLAAAPPVRMGRYVRVFAGDEFTCGLEAGGRALCWGRNDEGQLGREGPGGSAAHPVAGARGYRDLVLGPGRVCGRSGTHWFCWGDSGWWVLQNEFEGGAMPEPAPMYGTAWRWEGLAIGADHACGRSAQGEVSCWGNNERGQLGSEGEASSSPRRVDSPARFESLSAGVGRSCGVAGGLLYCWGSVAGAGGLTQQRPLLIP